MPSNRYLPYIETVSGKKVHFLNPDPDSIDIKDIAYALARIPRFNGHTSRFYSVAEHSWSGARYIEKKYALDFLLHDASEAYLGDISSPLKQCLPDYQAIEIELMHCICKKFGLQYPQPDIVKVYDTVLLSNEAHHLMPSRGNDWQLWHHVKRPIVSAEFRPIGLSTQVAYNTFLDKFYELYRD